MALGKEGQWNPCKIIRNAVGLQARVYTPPRVVVVLDGRRSNQGRKKNLNSVNARGA